MRAAVFAIGFVVGLALAPRAGAQSRPTRTAPQDVDAVENSAWERARYAVIVGEMRDASAFDGGNLGRRLAAGVARKLGQMGSIAVVRTNEATDEVRKLIHRRRLPVLRVEGRVTSIERRMLDGQVSVRCRIALMLLDEHGGALRSMLLGAATGVESPGRRRLAQDRQLAERALDGALDSALDGALEVIAGAARQAGIAPASDKQLALRR